MILKINMWEMCKLENQVFWFNNGEVIPLGLRMIGLLANQKTVSVLTSLQYEDFFSFFPPSTFAKGQTMPRSAEMWAGNPAEQQTNSRQRWSATPFHTLRGSTRKAVNHSFPPKESEKFLSRIPRSFFYRHLTFRGETFPGDGRRGRGLRVVNSWKWKTKGNVCEIRFTALVLLLGEKSRKQKKGQRSALNSHRTGSKVKTRGDRCEGKIKNMWQVTSRPTGRISRHRLLMTLKKHRRENMFWPSNSLDCWQFKPASVLKSFYKSGFQ